jgi:hypothetical protein
MTTRTRTAARSKPVSSSKPAPAPMAAPCDPIRLPPACPAPEALGRLSIMVSKLAEIEMDMEALSPEPDVARPACPWSVAGVQLERARMLVDELRILLADRISA